jgi:predicted small lipoprotein YifL
MRRALPFIFLTSICLGLGACGQKGPLFLPTEDSAPQAAAQSRSEQQPAAQPVASPVQPQSQTSDQ